MQHCQCCNACLSVFDRLHVWIDLRPACVGLQPTSQDNVYRRTQHNRGHRVAVLSHHHSQHTTGDILYKYKLRTHTSSGCSAHSNGCSRRKRCRGTLHFCHPCCTPPFSGCWRWVQPTSPVRYPHITIHTRELLPGTTASLLQAT